MAKTALIYMYKGCEPVETIGPADVLRRSGVYVILLAQTEFVEAGHGIVIKADKVGKEDTLHDCLILPGGMGWKNLYADEYAKQLATSYLKAGKLVAAICAAPTVALGYWGLIDNRKATCYPGMYDIGLKNCYFSEDRVVTDGNLITARGPGVSLEFGLEISRYLGGDYKQVGAAMLVK